MRQQLVVKCAFGVTAIWMEGEQGNSTCDELACDSNGTHQLATLTLPSLHYIGQLHASTYPNSYIPSSKSNLPLLLVYVFYRTFLDWCSLAGTFTYFPLQPGVVAVRECVTYSVAVLS